MLFYNRRSIAKQYTYIVTSAPSTPYIPLSVVKEHLRLDPTDTSQDTYLTMLISAAYNYGQQYTHRTFLTTTYKTYRDTFYTCCFVVRRSPLQAVSSIQYLKDNVLNTLSSTKYYTTNESMFARILKVDGQDWPTDYDHRQQCIEITFTAGYGTYSSIPVDLVMAMLQHIAKMYESRGDCDDAGCALALPATSKAIYDIYRIDDITGQTDCGYVYDNYTWYS